MKKLKLLRSFLLWASRHILAPLIVLWIASLWIDKKINQVTQSISVRINNIENSVALIQSSQQTVTSGKAVAASVSGNNTTTNLSQVNIGKTGDIRIDPPEVLIIKGRIDEGETLIKMITRCPSNTELTASVITTSKWLEDTYKDMRNISTLAGEIFVQEGEPNALRYGGCLDEEASDRYFLVRQRISNLRQILKSLAGI